MVCAEPSRTGNEESSSPLSRGLVYTLESIREAKRRISGMLVSSEREDWELLRNLDEIWEAYCDIESAIAMSKFVFGAYNKLGATRRLSISPKFDPTIMSRGEFRAKLEQIDSSLSLAESRFQQSKGEEAIELARNARDELKIMLVSHNRSENRGKKKKILCDSESLEIRGIPEDGRKT